MDHNNTHVRGYHFTMSQEGTWVSEGDKFIYTGPCGLSLPMKCNGSSMMIPHPDAFLDVSITMPPRRPPSPVRGPRVPMPCDFDEAGPSTRRRTWQDVFGMGEDEEMEQEDEEEDEVNELINIESSIEVIDISSDSESVEDPSEGSSLAASIGSTS